MRRMWNEAEKNNLGFHGQFDGSKCEMAVVSVKDQDNWLLEVFNGGNEHCLKPVLKVEVVHPS